MTNTVQFEKIIFHWCKINPDYLDKIRKKWFSISEIGDLTDLCLRFFRKFGDIPSKEQLLEIVEAKKYEISQDQIDTIFDVDLSKYEDQWLKENCEAWIEWKTLEESTQDLILLLTNAKPDSENIRKLVDDAKKIILERNNLQFDFAEGLDFFNPESHIQRSLEGYSTGYSFLDKCLGGGWAPKTLHCFLAPAKGFKSGTLCNLAANGVLNGHNTVYITLELEDKKVSKRIGSNLFNIDIAQYDEISRSPKMKEIISKFRASHPQAGSLWVREYPASSSSAIDIEGYLKKLEEKAGQKFFLVFIDYINIVKNWRAPNSENTYMKIKQISEDLRAIGQRNEWCMVTATQATKDAYENSDIFATNTSESSGLLHTVDSLFGQIRDSHMAEQQELYIKALLLRNSDGMGNKHRFITDFKHFRLVQDNSSRTIESII